MMQSIERYMKQAIVDRNPAVSSAALVSSLVSENWGKKTDLWLPKHFRVLKGRE